MTRALRLLGSLGSLVLAACAVTPTAAPPSPPVHASAPPDRTDEHAQKNDGLASPHEPRLDSDDDAFADADDRCVLEQETLNGFQDHDGCPDEIPEDLKKFTGVIKGIEFAPDRDILEPSARPVLDRAIAVLQRYPEVRIEISNHTDSTYKVEYSKDLPHRRAIAVKHYLVEHGIDALRIETRGAGPEEPIDTNRTPAGRARNRRTEFTLLVEYAGASPFSAAPGSR